MSRRMSHGVDYKTQTKPLVENTKQYLYSLRALWANLPDDAKQLSSARFVVIGKAEVWPCRDGAVILFYRDPEGKIEVITKRPTGMTMGEFAQQNPTMRNFYSPDGLTYARPDSYFAPVDPTREAGWNFADATLPVDNIIYRPLYQRGSFIGWDLPLNEPDVAANRDIQAILAMRNVLGNESKPTAVEEKQLARASYADLIDRFTALLGTAESEEELQVFLKEYPVFLYPNILEVFPKFKLGDDYVTDYVLRIQGNNGPEYVFVEIERANKPLFTGAGQFSSMFTQAKDQLLDWERWVSRNLAFVSQKLPGIYLPTFLLVMGRGLTLTDEQREKIRTEFSGTTRMFSTFDDLATRLQTTTDRLLDRLPS